MRGCTLMLLLSLTPGAFAQEEGAGKPAVSVRFQPATAIEPYMPVTVDGVAPIDGQGDGTVRITKPSGKELTLKVRPAANGDYGIHFTGTDEIGTYAVAAASLNNEKAMRGCARRSDIVSPGR